MSEFSSHLYLASTSCTLFGSLCSVLIPSYNQFYKIFCCYSTLQEHQVVVATLRLETHAMELNRRNVSGPTSYWYSLDFVTHLNNSICILLIVLATSAPLWFFSNIFLGILLTSSSLTAVMCYKWPFSLVNSTVLHVTEHVVKIIQYASRVNLCFKRVFDSYMRG